MFKKLGFLIIVLWLGFLFISSSVIASEKEKGENNSLAKFGLAIGSGIGIGLAAFGGGLGQGRIGGSAVEGIARNPGAADRIFVPMIIALALVESLVLYTFIIAIFFSSGDDLLFISQDIGNFGVKMDVYISFLVKIQGVKSSS